MKRNLRAFNAFMLHESGLSYRRIRERFGLRGPDRARALVARGQRMHLCPAAVPGSVSVEEKKPKPEKVRKSVRGLRYEMMMNAAVQKIGRI